MISQTLKSGKYNSQKYRQYFNDYTMEMVKIFVSILNYLYIYASVIVMLPDVGFDGWLLLRATTNLLAFFVESNVNTNSASPPASIVVSAPPYCTSAAESLIVAAVTAEPLVSFFTSILT